jgi:hypothetical protein
MSIFNKVYEAHTRAKLQMEQELAAKAAAEKAAANEFAAAFKQHIEFISGPIFEEFAKDARAHGFPARTEVTKDESGNVIYTLMFIPVAGAGHDTHQQHECACVIKAMVAERKIELASHFDKRPGRRVGFKSEILALPVVTAVVLERTLGELLSSALEVNAS